MDQSEMDDELCSACGVKLLLGEAEEREGLLLCATCAAREPGTLTSKTHECRFCEGVFSTPQELSSHVRRAHRKPRADRGRREGARMKVTEEGAAKTFQCKHHGCGQTFSSQAAFAGHVGGHKRAGSRRRTSSGRRARPSGAKPRFKCRRCGSTFVSLQEISAHARKAHPSDAAGHGAPAPSGPVSCPTCATNLPASVSWVARQFREQGVAEPEAERLAAIAYGLLRMPGGSS